MCCLPSGHRFGLLLVHLAELLLHLQRELVRAGQFWGYESKNTVGEHYTRYEALDTTKGGGGM